MTSQALVMVMIASITQPYWNYLAKKANGGLPFIWLTYAVGTLILLPFFLWALITTPVEFSYTVVGVVLVSGMLRLSYFIVLQTGYRQSDLSVVFPVARGSAPLFSTIGAVIFLQEALSLYSVVGLLLIVGGVLVITKPKVHVGNEQKGLFFGFASGVIIALYTVWDKSAVSHHNLSPFMLTFVSNFLGAILLVPWVCPQKNALKFEIKFNWWPVLAVAILSPLSYLLVLYAMKTTPVIYVAPTREISIVFAVFMGRQLMAEQNTKRRLIGALMIISGVMVLSV
jgi:drug/metabolite transporter (DMT)-like permease